MKIIEKVFNIQTGETTLTERDMTAEELARYEAEVNANELAKAEAQAKAAQRQALLDKLGITEDEARLLLGGN